jgi:hypothetical protein
MAGRRGVDVTTPNVARMYDYLLGGKDNFAADRQAAEKVLSIVPEARLAARANRAFLGRAVRFLAEAGIRQFIDLGTGVPTQANVHEIAHRVDPGARVVYVDNDPVVVVHAQALLHAVETATVIDADVRDPKKIIEHPELQSLIDFDEPVAVLMVAILHLVTDDEDPYGIVTAFHDVMAPGSYLALSHVTADPRPQAGGPVMEVYRAATAPMVPRTRGQVRRFFDGFELVDPGVVYAPEWHPAWEGEPVEPELSFILAGVGLKQHASLKTSMSRER